MAHSTYHRILRISLVVCAVVLVFQSGLFSQSTTQLSRNTQIYLASVIGMSASVQPTELNLMTARLTAKERELADREAALAEREISVGLNSEAQANSTATYILASILFILLVLILLNYILDYLRMKEEQKLKTV